VKILQPISNTKTETASRVRGRIEKVLDRAKALKLRAGDNPARWTSHLHQLLPKRSQVAPVDHHAALPYVDIPAFMAKLRERDSISARALEWTILCAARTGDTIGARRWAAGFGRQISLLDGCHCATNSGAHYPLWRN
jgi:hypothetical protein